MLGIGWQELAIIGISLVMCIGSLLLPIAVLILVLRKVRESRSTQLHQVKADTSQQPMSRQDRTRDPYETKYGFDETDWGVRPDNNVDDEPHIMHRQ